MIPLDRSFIYLSAYNCKPLNTTILQNGCVNKNISSVEYLTVT